MNKEKTEMVKQTLEFLKNKELIVIEKNNGQLVVNGRYDFWATTQKWQDREKQFVSKGLSQFLNYIEKEEV